MGSAEAIPNTNFHARAGIAMGLAPITRIDLQYAIDKVSGRFHLTAQKGSEPKVICLSMPCNAQQTISIRIQTKESTELQNGAVCSYQFLGPQQVSIFVSNHAHHDHLERALTHELSEINFALHLRLKHGSDPTIAEELCIYRESTLPVSDQPLRQQLTPHDIGRLSELDYVFGVRGGGGMDAKQQWATLTHLGLANDTPDAIKRITLLNYLPQALIDPRTVKHIQLRLRSPLQPSIVPAPLRTSTIPPDEVKKSTPPESRPSPPNPPTLSSSQDTSRAGDVASPAKPPEASTHEQEVADFHQGISEQLAEALDHALEARQVWNHYQDELVQAENNYAQAAGTTGKALKDAEARCKAIASTLKEVRAQSNSSSEVVRLQVSLRQAHFELGQIRQSHNKSISETEVRVHQRHIQIAQSREEKAHKEMLDALAPVMRLILTTLDIRRQPQKEWAKHALLQVRKGWRTTDEALEESVGPTLTVATDTKEECLRLQRDLQAIAQQLERVEGRNNNQRQVDSLSSRQLRVGQELERARRKLERAIRAYREIWTGEDVLRLRKDCEDWARQFNELVKRHALHISEEEGLRTTTRAARIQALERQVHTTIEHLLTHAMPELNQFLDEWAKPEGDLGEQETALTASLTQDVAWEWREQLTDMTMQKEAILYPNPSQIPDPDALQP